jgi:hypothetical protein
MGTIKTTTAEAKSALNEKQKTLDTSGLLIETR